MYQFTCERDGCGKPFHGRNKGMHFCSNYCAHIVQGEKRKALNSVAGQTFGRLTVLYEIETLRTDHHSFWQCSCACGNEAIVARAHLVSGHTKSCKCLSNDMAAARTRTHGHTVHGSTGEYNAWIGMKDRCRNPNNEFFHCYGGRGIRVCDKWNESFVSFIRDVGPKPMRYHTIDRINNDGHYEPGNVRWATAKEQANNRRLPVQRIIQSSSLA